jgi:CubicO group peptidase (beta-lactamase class C family)
VLDLLANRSRLPLRAELEFTDFSSEEDDVLSRFAAEIASREPIAGFWSYTNAGWCLLGRAIEELTGLTWEEAMRATLLAPVGMDETAFRTQTPTEPCASGHKVTADGPTPVEPWAPQALGPAGSTLLSTLSDMLRFASLHLEDPYLAALRAPQAEVRIHGCLDAWCLGWGRFDWDDGPVWGWDGVISGQRAILRIMPERHGAVVLLTNGNTGRAVYRSLFGELMPGVVGHQRAAAAPRAVTRCRRRSVAIRRRLRVAGQVVDCAGDRRRARRGGRRPHNRGDSVDDRSFLVDARDPDNPSVPFGALDSSGRPGARYVMLWELPRV